MTRKREAEAAEAHESEWDEEFLGGDAWVHWPGRSDESVSVAKPVTESEHVARPVHRAEIAESPA